MKVIEFITHEHFLDYKNRAGMAQHLFSFPNGYGASVVRHFGTYGYEDGLFELAVLDQVIQEEDGYHVELTYDTPITDDVLGWLSVEEVLEILGAIKSLPHLYNQIRIE